MGLDIIIGEVELIDKDGNSVLVKEGTRLTVQDERLIRTVEMAVDELRQIRQLLAAMSDE